MPVDAAPISSPHWRAALWPLLVAALVIVASSRSYVAAPDVSHIDKVAHFAVYGLLGTLVRRLGRGWRAAAWAVVLVSLFGVSDEWHQSFVPGRTCEVGDWIADTLGAALAVTLYTGWPWYRARLEAPCGRRADPRAGLDPAIG